MRTRPGRVSKARTCWRRRLRAGLAHRLCLCRRRAAERLLEGLSLPPEIDVSADAARIARSGLATETPQPVAALVEPPDWTWAHLLRRPDRRTARRWSLVLAGLAGPRQPGDDCALGGGFWRRRRALPAGHRERVEPKSGTRLGGQRLSRPAAVRERGGSIRASARGGCKDLVDRPCAGTARRSCRPGRAGCAAHRQ